MLQQQEIWDASKALCQLGCHLSGGPVLGLLAAEDQVEPSFHIGRFDDGVAGGEGIRAAEGTPGDQNRLIAAHGQALPQGALGHWRPHGDERDLSAVFFLDLNSRLQGVEIQGVGQRGHTGADQISGFRIHPDQVNIRNLLDADKYIQHISLLSACERFVADLAGIQNAVRVKDLLDLSHQPEDIFPDGFLQIYHLGVPMECSPETWPSSSAHLA